MKKWNSIKKSSKFHEFNINETCTPEFVNLRPKSILPLETTAAVTGANASSVVIRKRDRPVLKVVIIRSVYAIWNWFSMTSGY